MGYAEVERGSGLSLKVWTVVVGEVKGGRNELNLNKQRGGGGLGGPAHGRGESLTKTLRKILWRKETS